MKERERERERKKGRVDEREREKGEMGREGGRESRGVEKRGNTIMGVWLHTCAPAYNAALCMTTMLLHTPAR